MFRPSLIVFLLGTPAHSEIPTQPAERFVDSIGVCTHFSYFDTPYGTAYERVKQQLLASGIRHIRDSYNEKIIELGKAGIRATILADDGKPVAHTIETIKKANGAGARIVAVEGPNEPDLFWKNFKKSYKGQGHEQGTAGIVAGTIGFQKELYAAIKSDPQTRDLTVIGPSLGVTYDYDVKSPFGKGTLTESVDWGNFHPYAGGNPFSPPFPYAGLERYTAQGSHPGATMDENPYAFDIYAPPFAPKPMAATEAGYSTFIDGPSEASHAKNLPRMFCEFFRKGVVRTYSYELIDEWNKPGDRESNFGLIRFDQSPKPAFHVLQRLIRLVEEPNAALTHDTEPFPGTLEVKPAKNFDRTQYVHHVALQRADGTFILLLWHEIALDDVSKKPWRRLPLAPPMPTTLTLSMPAKHIEVFIPNDGEKPMQSLENVNQVTLGVPDRVMVVKIKF